jgi:hypothetical protein
VSIVYSPIEEENNMTNQAYVEELSNGQLISVARMAKRSVWKNTKFMKLLYCELRCSEVLW